MVENIDYSLVSTAFGSVLELLAPFIIVMFVFSVISSLLQTAFQIFDPIFGFVAKLFAIVVLLFFLSSNLVEKYSLLTERYWKESDTYY